MGARGTPGFEDAEGCEHFFVITADPAAASPIEGTETLGRRSPASRRRSRPCATAADDTAVILYTSAAPRASPRAPSSPPQHAAERAGRRPAVRRDADGADAYLCALPLFHSFGQTVIQNAGFAFGGTARAAAALRRRARRWSSWPSEDVTFFAGVPTMYWGLLSALDDGVDVAADRRQPAASPSSGGSRASRSRSSRTSRRRSASRSSRATACPRPRRSRPSATVRRGARGPARSACPIWGVEMKLIDDDWKTSRASGRGRARSRSAATTS